MSFLDKIKSGSELTVTTYGPSQQNDEELQTLVNELSLHYGIEDFAPILFTLVKDLILNGYKANFKRIFFLEKRLNIDSPGEYEIGIRQFKSLMQQGKTSTYDEKAKSQGFFVELSVKHSSDEIFAQVSNNNPLAVGEMAKIKHSLFHSQNYNDIMEYYIERGDNSEGEGIGIALCVILLKGEGLPTNGFQIKSQNGQTIASLRIPLAPLRSQN